jgi:hypothetical protein
MMNTGPPAYNSNGMSRSGYEVVGQDISHLSEPVNSLDPLNAMEKSLNDQVSTWFCVFFSQPNRE